MTHATQLQQAPSERYFNCLTTAVAPNIGITAVLFVLTAHAVQSQPYAEQKLATLVTMALIVGALGALADASIGVFWAYKKWDTPRQLFALFCFTAVGIGMPAISFMGFVFLFLSLNGAMI
jgi:hypothetical protein